MTAWYNEIDPFKAEVLREAIKAGAIAPGVVDERSIKDVRAEELVRFTQCHFFAGGGFWSLALRQAGWPDDRTVWTGSCPCPSFSAAGKGEGFNDPRHLWPDWYALIRKCRPAVVFGEQVAAAIGHGWLDLVCGEMESQGYAIAAAVLGAHSVGAPHIRQRLYFVAIAAGSGREWWRPGGESSPPQETIGDSAEQEPQQLRDAGGSAIPMHAERWPLNINGSAPGQTGHAAQSDATSEREQPISAGLEGHSGDVREWRGPGWLDPEQARSASEAGATGGFWADCDWWYGRDGKYRPIESGILPLAHRSPARVGRLRMYGDAIVVPAAQAFIESYLEIEDI